MVTGEGATGGIELRVLGSLEAVRDGGPVSLGGPKPRAVLARLALGAGRPVRTEALVDALWGEAPPATATKTVQKYVSLLRTSLGEPGVVTHADGYALMVPPDRVDAARFEGLLDAAADSGSVARSAALLQEALSLWRGEPFTELGELSEAVGERARLRERRLEAVEALTEARLASGQHARLVGQLEELVGAHPLRERLWGQLMVALYRSGRQADALDAYRRLRATLSTELGIDPSAALRELEQRILRQDPDLDTPAREADGDETVGAHLPTVLSSFIGRETELAQVSSLLSDRRLVTLTGPAGSGKTRLATEVARRDVERHPDGVWFVDLASLRSPDEVPTAMADPFGVKGRPERPVEAVLVEYLEGRQLLLVVDNCEHLVDDVAALITRLLRSVSRLQVLATSREPLRVEGESTFEVPPLAVPEDRSYEQARGSDAVRLFVERSRAVAADFALTPDNASALVDVCRRLDGLPLALELAATRVRAFAPAELVRLLDERFAVLGSAPRTAPSRQQTLQAAVDWSYDLLPPDEQTLLAQLSVFRGGFDLEAVTQVCSSVVPRPTDALSLLPELVDKSLVVSDHRSYGHTRYRLLETIREYGQDRLDASETARLRDVHTAYFCALAEQGAPQLRGPEQQRWILRLRMNYDNLRNALQWGFAERAELGIRLAIALADYWDAVGPRTEAHHWLQRAVDLTESGHRNLHVPARLAASDLFLSTDVSHSLRFAEEALAEARRAGDERSEAAALRALAWARALQGEHDAALSAGEQALRIWTRLDEPWEIAWTLERLARADYRDPDRSYELLEEGLNLYRQVGDQRRAGMMLYKMAEVGVRSGRPLEALEERVRESIGIFDALGNIHDSAHALLELGKIQRRQGRLDQARETLESGLERLRMVGDQRCTVRTLTALGTTLIEEGDHRRAWNVLRESLEVGRPIHEHQTIRVALAGVARLCTLADRWQDAALLVAAAASIARDSGLRVTGATSARRSALVERIRAALPPEVFDEMWRTGEAMTPEEAADIALGMPTPPLAS